MTGRSSARGKRRRPRQIAPVVSQLRERFRITHPFHPRRGEEFELIRYHRSWGQDESVEGRGAAGERINFPLSWTDAGAEDPFFAVANGRSYFRVDDLLRLATLLEQLG
jgi:Family of unknown function (DUF5372)